MNNNFFNILEKNYNIKLNDQQKNAVLHKEGPAAILAVPGSGKTTVLICRTANLIINHGIRPQNILSVTFSKASAFDMDNRFNSIFGSLISDKIRFSTIHSFAYYVIREYSSITGIKFNVIEDDKASVNKISLLKQIYLKVNNSYINEDKLEELITNISFAKNMMLEEEEFKKFNIGVPGFKDIYRQYENFKKQNDLIDYDDMLSLTYEILKSSPILLNKYRNRFNYIQVDEGQDTSKVQHEIIKLLAHPRNNIFLVGDEDQSIYSFRGAYPEAIINFEKGYPGAKVFFMEENFRSTKSIVSIANEFIKGNKVRYNKNLFTQRDEGDEVEVINLKDEREQIKYVINKLTDLQNLNSTAVLFRNNISCIPLVDALNRQNIKFYTKDFKLSLFKHWVVQDIYAFISFALNSEDIEAFERIYYKMNSYIPKKAIEYVKKHSKHKCVFSAIKMYPEFNSFQISRIDRLKSSFQTLTYKRPKDAIEYIESDLTYKKYVEESSERLGYSIDSINQILAILKLIAEGTTTIVGFLNRLEELQKIIEEAKHNKYKDAVTLSTIHSSKGLEFDSVYMIDLIEGEFPSLSSIEAFEKGKKEHMEEERRLFYVGMTRARNKLKLLKIGSKNGDKISYSRFLGEIFTITNQNIEGDKDIESNYESLKCGCIVNHCVFGLGRVKCVSKNVVEIDFEKSGLKTLLLDTCIEKNLITIIA